MDIEVEAPSGEYDSNSQSGLSSDLNTLNLVMEQQPMDVDSTSVEEATGEANFKFGDGCKELCVKLVKCNYETIETRRSLAELLLEDLPTLGDFIHRKARVTDMFCCGLNEEDTVINKTVASDIEDSEKRHIILRKKRMIYNKIQYQVKALKRVMFPSEDEMTECNRLGIPHLGKRKVNVACKMSDKNPSACTRARVANSNEPNFIASDDDVSELTDEEEKSVIDNDSNVSISISGSKSVQYDDEIFCAGMRTYFNKVGDDVLYGEYCDGMSVGDFDVIESKASKHKANLHNVIEKLLSAKVCFILYFNAKEFMNNIEMMIIYKDFTTMTVGTKYTALMFCFDKLEFGNATTRQVTIFSSNDVSSNANSTK